MHARHAHRRWRRSASRTCGRTPHSASARTHLGRDLSTLYSAGIAGSPYSSLIWQTYSQWASMYMGQRVGNGPLQSTRRTHNFCCWAATCEHRCPGGLHFSWHSKQNDVLHCAHATGDAWDNGKLGGTAHTARQDGQKHNRRLAVTVRVRRRSQYSVNAPTSTKRFTWYAASRVVTGAVRSAPAAGSGHLRQTG